MGRVAVLHGDPAHFAWLFGRGGTTGVQSLNEWCFEFQVTGRQPIPRRMADELLCVEATGWAEARRLGIGGGYRPGSPEVGKAAWAWCFRFGLCVQEEGLSLPESQASELLELVRGWCQSRGFEFAGGFRAFTPAECDPDASP